VASHILTCARAVRPAEKFEGGGHRTGRTYADFVVDGVPLGPRMREVRGLIGRLGWGPMRSRRETLATLLLEGEADFPPNRRAIYVCAECGDLACGTVTAVMERQGDEVVWRDFQYETEIDPPLSLAPLSGLGPFSFHWPEYERTLRQAAEISPPNADVPTRPWWKKCLSLWYRLTNS
jgi:hypothetical protein